MWNDLPEKTKQTSSFYCFKKWLVYLVYLYSSFLSIVFTFSTSFVPL